MLVRFQIMMIMWWFRIESSILSPYDEKEKERFHMLPSQFEREGLLAPDVVMDDLLLTVWKVEN